jgi:hypothetical protein
MGNLSIKRRNPASVPWDAITYFGSDLDSFWDTVDASGFSLTGSVVNTWTPLVGTRTATKASTGPNYSATARNGRPGVIFTGSTAERLTFSATGLPTGAPNVTLVAVGFAADNTNSKTALSYGGAASNWIALRSVLVTASPTGTMRTTGQYFVPSNSFSVLANYMKTWRNEDRIAIGEFFSTSVNRQHIDGDSNLPAFQYVTPTNVTTTSGRIGCLTTDSSAWDGVLQGLMIITRTLTQLEKDKLSVWLANRYGLAANISIINPYCGGAPTVYDSTTSHLISGIGAGAGVPMESKWFDGFTNLSRRQGTYRSGDSTGYNDPASKGAWAFCGENDMSSTKGGFYNGGQDVFINPSFNWQALDPTYPYLGQVDITANGLELFGSGDYPAVRQSAYGIQVPSGGWPYLGASISTPQSAKVGPPGAHRFRYTVTGSVSDNVYSFPATWALGDRYNGTIKVVASISGTTMTVTSITFMPDGQALWPNTKLSTRIAGILPNTQIVQQLTGTEGGIGTYQLDIAQTVASTAIELFYPHQEFDGMEVFGSQNNSTTSLQHTHILVDGLDVGRGMNFDMGPSQDPIIGGGEQEASYVFSTTDIYYLTKSTAGEDIITSRQAWPAGTIPDKDRFHAILTQACGLSFEVYPGRFQGAISDGSGGAGNILTMTQLTSGKTILQAGQTISLGGVAGAVQGVLQPFGTGGTTGTGGAGTYIIDGIARLVSATPMQATPALLYNPRVYVRSVEMLAPVSNTAGLYPPASPTPIVTWGGSFAGGSVPAATASGTTIAALSGASTYAVFPRLSTFTGLSVTGTSLKTSGTLSAGTYEFYIEGTDASGVPGIAPKLTLTVT